MSRRDRRPLHSPRPRPKRPVLPEGKAPGEPNSRVEAVRAAVADADWKTALRLAKELSGLGEDEKVITRAWEALVRPRFLREVGKDPDATYEEGVATLKRRFG